MEQQDLIPEDYFQNYQPIYSSKAIRGFAFLFNPIFGGVLLFQNLRTLGKKKESIQVLIFSILFSGLIIYIVNLSDKPNTGLTYVLNLTGGLILTEYFFKKYIPRETDYSKKKIWKALIISIVITIPLLAAAILAA